MPKKVSANSGSKPGSKAEDKCAKCKNAKSKCKCGAQTKGAFNMADILKK